MNGYLFVFALVFSLSLCCGNALAENMPFVENKTVTAPLGTVAQKADLQKLKGKWRRPDGGYVIEIKAVEKSGKLDASYFNPRPINISKAQASQDGETIKAFIELRDVNYPGSTYNLIYHPENDSLAGIYYQAALQQQFEVVFVRMS